MFCGTSSVWEDEIAGQARNDDKKNARNDGIGHPGPDPGSNSPVCTDELCPAANAGVVDIAARTDSAAVSKLFAKQMTQIY